jgi:cysteine-rich repeat protein
VSLRRADLTILLVVAPAVAAPLAVACFSGSDALGLPCEKDEDCGLDQSCIDGFCGGPPDSTGTDTTTDATDEPVCGDGVVDEGEECDDGDTDDTDECPSTCALATCGDGFVWAGEEECDDANQDESDACLSSCVHASCGDGYVWAGEEECDDGADNGEDQACKPDCTEAVCGDGLVAPSEACDDAGESADCDDDCTLPECGDGNHNAAAGEACDAPGDAGCLDDCRLVYFQDDMEQGVGEWTQTVEHGSLSESWNLSNQRAVSGQTSWYTDTPQTSAGSLRLESGEIDLTGATAPIELTFVHFYEFDYCDGSNLYGDGAFVEIYTVSGDEWLHVSPLTPYPDVIDSGTCGAGQDNPLAGTSAWTHTSEDQFLNVTVELDDYAGEMIRVGFHVAYDCDNCNPTEGWYFDDILVAGY